MPVKRTGISKKVCMLGTFAVGKTSLVRQFVYSKFTDDYLSTIGVQMSNKTVSIDIEGTDYTQDINLILWDLAHVEKFDAVIKAHLHGSHGAIIVFDLTRPHSFSEYDSMIKGFLDINPGSKLVLAGNKSDLSNDDEPRQQINNLANELNCSVFYTSAKTADNVNALFLSLAKQFI